MDKLETIGLIILNDDYNFEYKIAKIKYIFWQDNSFEYEFTPYYQVIDLLDSKLFQGIPGIDLSLRKGKYVRKNIIPVFISERCPNENREDLWEYLNSANMDYFNQLQWLINTDMKYSGDKLLVREYRKSDEKTVVTLNESVLKQSAYNLSKKLLQIICHGDDVKSEKINIDDTNRKQYYDLLYMLYINDRAHKNSRLEKARKVAKEENLLRGRKRKNIDEAFLDDIYKLYEDKTITIDQAAKILNISLATTYRRFSEKRKNDK